MYPLCNKSRNMISFKNNLLRQHPKWNCLFTTICPMSMDSTTPTSNLCIVPTHPLTCVRWIVLIRHLSHRQCWYEYQYLSPPYLGKQSPSATCLILTSRHDLCDMSFSFLLPLFIVYFHILTHVYRGLQLNHNVHFFIP